MPTLTIFAGVNGAGKSTLYSYQASISNGANPLGERVNPDEILQAFNGDWSSTTDMYKSAKIALSKIANCLNENKTFNWELSILTPFVIKKLQQAKSQGYTINMYYVCVNNVQIAKSRVLQRQQNGGHGVPPEIIEQRFNNQFNHMGTALKFIDTAVFFDNSNSAQIVASYSDGHFTFVSQNTKWVKWLGLLNADEQIER